MASCLWNHRLTAVCAFLVVCTFASSVYGQATAPSVIIRTTVETCKRGISPGSVVCDRRIATNANVESVLLDGYRESSAVVTNNGETMRATTHARNDIAVARGPAFWDEVSGTVTVEVYLKYTGAETEIYQVYVDQIYRHTESTGTHLSANAEATTSTLSQDSLGLPQVGPNNFFQEGTAGSFRGGLVTLPEYPGIQYKGTIYQGLAANVRHTIALNDGVDERMFGLVDWVVEVKARLKANPPPVAVIEGPFNPNDFTSVTSKIFVGKNYSFTSSKSYDPDDGTSGAGIILYRWNIIKPDNSTYNVTYNSALSYLLNIDQEGTYKITLTVTDDENQVKSTEPLSVKSIILKPEFLRLTYHRDQFKLYAKDPPSRFGNLYTETHFKSSSGDVNDLIKEGIQFDEELIVIGDTNSGCPPGYVRLPLPWGTCERRQVFNNAARSCWGRDKPPTISDSNGEDCGDIVIDSLNDAWFGDGFTEDRPYMYPLVAGRWGIIQKYKYTFATNLPSGELNHEGRIIKNVVYNILFEFYAEKNGLEAPIRKPLPIPE